MPQTIQGSNPLEWPAGWPRRPIRKRNAHFKRTFGDACFLLLEELTRIGASSCVLSTNVPLRLDGMPRAGAPMPADPAIAIYFERNGEKVVLACDLWDLPEHNILAIAKHVEALRGQERWGVGTLERAFSAYKALPGKGETSQTRAPWRHVLGFGEREPVGEDLLRERYRDLVARAHPDQPEGSPDRFKAINDARDDARLELGIKPAARNGAS